MDLLFFLQDFWLWLIGDSVKWGLQMYEQDWLYVKVVFVGSEFKYCLA